MLENFRSVYEFRGFIREHAGQALHARYRGSVLGFLWSFLTPLLVSFCFGFIFATLNKITISEYLPYFLAGYVAWQFFAGVSGQATGAIVGNAHFVNRVFVPRAVFPISLVAVNFVDLLSGLVATLVVILVLVPQKLHLTVLLLPIPILLLVVFVTGIALLTATINVFFRDFQFIWSTIVFLAFFMTPILFRTETMPEAMRIANNWNVVYPFIRIFQDLIANGVIPAPEYLVSATLYAVASLFIGAATFQRWERQFYMYV